MYNIFTKNNHIRSDIFEIKKIMDQFKHFLKELNDNVYAGFL